MMNFEEVKGFLKQRFPILMVDKVLEMEKGKSIKAIKNVTGNEICFLGHFPDYAILPGIFIIEAIGQSASILFSASTGRGMDDGGLMVLGSVNSMRFLNPVVPGDTMVMEVNIVKIVEDAAIIEGTASVNGVIAAKGNIVFGRKKI